LSYCCSQYFSAMISDFLWLRVSHLACFRVLKFAPSWNVGALLPRQEPLFWYQKPIDDDGVALNCIPPAWARGVALDYSRRGVDGHTCCIGEDNFAAGLGALQHNTSGNSNIAFGVLAGSLLTTGDNNIDIGNEGVAVESNTIRIGTQGTQTHAYIAGIYQTSVAKGLAVVVDSTGHLGTKGSSQRFKEAIKPMDKASEAIHALKPVTFRYKHELDPDSAPQFGLVAEDVEKINPDLVVRDADGKVYFVRYDAVNAMPLNEFLKEHRKNEEQGATITRLIATDTRQQKQIEALTAALQKVSAQLELTKPAQTVPNSQ
jgi:Chaperone of endosialidase